MSTLPWRLALEVELNDELVPNPFARHQKLQRLDSVWVAVDGPFLWIDPRPDGSPDVAPTDPEFDAYAVPAAAVRVIRYRVRKSERPSGA